MATEANARIVKPPAEGREVAPHLTEDSGTFWGNKLGTVALVGLGVALIETEWIPGLLLGAAAMLVPDVLPKLGKGLRPLIKETVRAGYALADRTREGVAEMGEQFQDIVAEVKSEQHHPANVPVEHAEGAPAAEAPATGTSEAEAGVPANVS
jgi:hypothetical protein